MLPGEYESLIGYEVPRPEAKLFIPTLDHYLPILYVLGTSQQDKAITFPIEGVYGGSISMLTVVIRQMQRTNEADL